MTKIGTKSNSQIWVIACITLLILGIICYRAYIPYNAYQQLVGMAGGKPFKVDGGETAKEKIRAIGSEWTLFKRVGDSHWDEVLRSVGLEPNYENLLFLLSVEPDGYSWVDRQNNVRFGLIASARSLFAREGFKYYSSDEDRTVVSVYRDSIATVLKEDGGSIYETIYVMDAGESGLVANR